MSAVDVSLSLCWPDFCSHAAEERLHLADLISWHIEKQALLALCKLLEDAKLCVLLS